MGAVSGHNKPYAYVNGLSCVRASRNFPPTDHVLLSFAFVYYIVKKYRRRKLSFRMYECLDNHYCPIFNSWKSKY